MKTRSSPTFRQLDVTRVVRATVAAGVVVARIEIEDGKITVVTGKPVESEPTDHFEKWKMKPCGYASKELTASPNGSPMAARSRIGTLGKVAPALRGTWIAAVHQ